MLGLLVASLGAAAPSPGNFLYVEGEGVARMAYGFSEPMASSREVTARAFLARYRTQLGLVPEDELRTVSDEHGVLVMERRRGARAILNGELKATFNERGQLVMVHVGAPVGPTEGDFWVDSTRAEAVAGAGLDGVALVESRPLWRRMGPRLEPVWLVRLATAEPLEPWRALVDAQTGRLLYRISERLSAGVGNVYDVSPAKGPVVMRSLGGLPPGATTLVGSRATARSCDGAAVGGSCMPRAQADPSGDFLFTPNPLVSNTDRFAEVTGYYATDRFSAWLSSLDAGVSLPPIDVYTNVGNSNQGFFLGGGARFAIELGQGPAADWAYEGDVTFHELGHGVVQRTANFGFYGTDNFGIDGEGGSLNEGSADCVALALTNDAVLGDFIGPFLRDAGNLINPYLRRMDSRFTCHGNDGNLDGGDPGRMGEIHDDGRIIGSFFWAVHTATQGLGPNAAATGYVLALRSVNGSAGFREVALAMQQHMASRFGAQAGELTACLACSHDLPGCSSGTRRIYAGETHEARLLGNDSIAPTMANGERPQTFQYEISVPANAAATVDRLAVTSGMLPKVYARFGSRVSWAGGNPTFDVVVTAPGQMLPARPSAGVWYLQGALTDPGAGTRRYGLRVQVAGAAARPPRSPESCSLGSGVGSCNCVPQCAGRSCGADGCGGSCGGCDAGTACVADRCVCLPQCAGRACGPDGCGGMCGTCASGTCNAATGSCEGCTPMCAGKQCGPNGCGQACGQCAAANVVCELSSGQCVDAGTLALPDAGVDAGIDDGGTGGQVVGGCGCQVSGLGSAWTLVTLVLTLRRRRTKGRAHHAPDRDAAPLAP